MNKFHWFWIVIIILFLGSLLGSICLPPILLPLNSKIPDREIVFNYWDGKVDKIGFINSDGSGFTERDIRVPTGLFDYDFPLKIYTNNVSEIVRWSENGDGIGLQYYRYSPVGGIPFLINRNGEFLMCPVKSTPRLYHQLRVYEFIGQGHVIAVENSKDQKKLAIYDMQSCQIISEFGQFGKEENLYGVQVSKQDWLALWYSMDGKDQTIIISPDGKIQATLYGASLPSWSNDGFRLAYQKNDNLYIAERDGSKVNMIWNEVDLECPAAWSPDGEKLVIEYPDAMISVLNMVNGDLVTIFENGLCPDWQ